MSLNYERHIIIFPVLQMKTLRERKRNLIAFLRSKIQAVWLQNLNFHPWNIQNLQIQGEPGIFRRLHTHQTSTDHSFSLFWWVWKNTIETSPFCKIEHTILHFSVMFHMFQWKTLIFGIIRCGLNLDLRQVILGGDFVFSYVKTGKAREMVQLL